MARDPGRNLARERIAHLAARLMAQDGIEDYALAKRKAARQAGISETRQLPNNNEIESALRLYRQLYQKEHPAQLRELRKLALQVMDEFAEFNPHLTGSVLRGDAGKYAVIHLQLFAENSKRIQHFLLDQGVEFSGGEARLYAGDRHFNAPVLKFERSNIEIHLTLLGLDDQRTQLKSSPEGRPIERARREAVAVLVAAG